MLLEWKGFRRMYIYAMTENMKAILRRWSNALFTEEIRYVRDRKQNIRKYYDRGKIVVNLGC